MIKKGTRVKSLFSEFDGTYLKGKVTNVGKGKTRGRIVHVLWDGFANERWENSRDLQIEEVDA